jgi:flagellar basal body L-ring protein FlgH
MFEVIIVSPIFEGKRLLARHKLVNEALKEEISKVHAFTQVNKIITIIIINTRANRENRLDFNQLNKLRRNRIHLLNGKRSKQSNNNNKSNSIMISSNNKHIINNPM